MVPEKSSAAVGKSSSGDPCGALDSFTRGFVRKAARQFAGRCGFLPQDREEIEQRLYLKLAGRLHAADPDAPQWKALVAITVRRHLASLLRDLRAQKRDPRRGGSLHVHIGTPDGPVELADLVGEHDLPSRRGRAERSDQELAELRLDLVACLDDVADERQRDFYERLKHDSISQVARDLDIPRTTLHAWVAKLRARFAARGLQDYL